MPAKAGFAEALGQGPAGGEPRQSPDRDAAPGPRRAARAALARDAGATMRPRTAWSGSCSRRWARCEISGRPVDGKSVRGCCSRSAARRSGRRRARARWAPGVRRLREGRVDGGGEDLGKREARRRVLGGVAPARRRLARDARAAGDAAAEGRRGRERSRPRSRASGSHALLVYPSTRFYDGRGADRAWLQEAPDTMTQVTWDGWVEIPTETASQARRGARRPRQADVAARPHRAARVSVGVASSRGGGGGDGAGHAPYPGALRAAARAQHRRQPDGAARRRAGGGLGRPAVSRGEGEPRQGRGARARSRSRRPPRPGRSRDRAARRPLAARASSSCGASRPSTRATRACTRRSKYPERTAGA